MTQITVFQILTLIAALAATIVAVATFRRAGAWRLSDDGKRVDSAIFRLEAAVESEGGVTLKADIHAIKNELTKINARLGRAEQADEGLPAIVERVTRVETALESVASSGDFRALKAEVEGLEAITRNTHAAVSRIEGWLVEGRGQ